MSNPSSNEQAVLEDNIYNLKQDNVPPSPEELKVIGTLFGNSVPAKKSSNTGKVVLVATIVFFLLSLPFIDRILSSVHSSCEKTLVRTFVKSIIFMIIFFILYLQITK